MEGPRAAHWDVVPCPFGRNLTHLTRTRGSHLRTERFKLRLRRFTPRTDADASVNLPVYKHFCEAAAYYCAASRR